MKSRAELHTEVLNMKHTHTTVVTKQAQHSAQRIAQTQINSSSVAMDIQCEIQVDEARATGERVSSFRRLYLYLRIGIRACRD